MLFDLLFSLQNFHEIKKKTKNRPVLHMLVRSSLSTAEALKKVFDNLMNNVMIKLLKLVLGGSNLFPDMGWRGMALFARDIRCLKNQNSLLRNVCLPHMTLPPLPGFRATEELCADKGLTRGAELYFCCLSRNGLQSKRRLEFILFAIVNYYASHNAWHNSVHCTFL